MSKKRLIGPGAQMNREMESIQMEIRQLENRRKILLNRKHIEERRERTHRLIERGAMLESVFPSLKTCSNEAAQAFLLRLSRLPDLKKLITEGAESSDAG